MDQQEPRVERETRSCGREMLPSIQGACSVLRLVSTQKVDTGTDHESESTVDVIQKVERDNTTCEQESLLIRVESVETAIQHDHGREQADRNRYEKNRNDDHDDRQDESVDENGTDFMFRFQVEIPGIPFVPVQKEGPGYGSIEQVRLQQIPE